MASTLPEPVQEVVDGAARLGMEVNIVVAVALIGSYARGTARGTSDVDLVILCDTPEALLKRDDWHQFFDPEAVLIRSHDFGALQERRLLLPSDLVVEVDIGRTSWAAHDPVDAGTLLVVHGGFVILYDPDRLLEHLGVAAAE